MSEKYLVSPWVPMKDPIDLKHIGKLAEESTELATVASRCVIQGVEEKHPLTGKPNIEWLEDEIADVLATIELVAERFDLDTDRILERSNFKMEKLREWFSMSGGTDNGGEHY